MKKHKIIIITILALIITIAFPSCDTTNPPSNNKITLEVEDASCTEAWLNLKLQNVSLPTAIKITEGDSTFLSTSINSSDTTLFVENLFPSQTYTFQTIIQSTNQKSNSVSVTTMDTTSHNFTWETFTFGGVHGSSILKDVAIINENDIWAVGEIHTAETDQFDSNGVWVQPYNAVHWDGSKWALIRIGGYGYWAYSTVYAFNENDVWFDGTVQWDGIRYTAHTNNFPLEPNGDGWRVNGMWGVSSEDFYVVGNGGNIAHYNGSSWKKIESGTEIGILDICGNDKDEIYAIGTEYNTGESILLKIENKRAEKIIESSYHADLSNLFKTELYGMLGSVWTTDKGYMIIAGHYIYNHFKNKWSYAQGVEKNYVGSGQVIHRGYIHSICGTAVNDWFLIGEYGTIQHFNGVASIQVGEPFNYQNPYDWYGSDAKNNLVVAVGKKGGLASIRILKK